MANFSFNSKKNRLLSKYFWLFC